MEILTLTHARIRAGQGDVTGARRVLRAILELSPNNAEAQALLEELSGRAGREVAAERGAPLPAPEGADARSLAEEFRRSLGSRDRNSDVTGRVRRLETWLTRIRGGDRDVR
jgi:hypothetical protein